MRGLSENLQCKNPSFFINWLDPLDLSKRKKLSDLCYICPRGTREGMPLFFWEKRVFVKHTNNHPNTPNYEVHPAGNARSPPSGQWLLMSTQRWEFFTVGQFQFGKITKWMNHKLVGYQFGSFTMGVNLKKVNRYLEFVTERGVIAIWAMPT